LSCSASDCHNVSCSVSHLPMREQICHKLSVFLSVCVKYYNLSRSVPIGSSPREIDSSYIISVCVHLYIYMYICIHIYKSHAGHTSSPKYECARVYL